MVGKLLKHEFIALGRVLLPTAIVVLVLSLLSAMSLPTGEQDMTTIQALVLLFFITSIMVIMILTYVICIKRFNDSLFSKQGYMTLSLPVTPLQLLLAKALAAVTAMVFSFLVVLLAGILFSVRYNFIVLDLIWDIIVAVFSLLEPQVTPLIIYALFTGLVGLISTLLLIYACIAAGQFVNKHRTALSVVAFFVVSEIVSVISSFITVKILNAYASLTVSLLFSVAVGVGSVFFIRYVLKNKVNLLA